MENKKNDSPELKGHILIFHAFDVGDEVDLNLVQKESGLTQKNVKLPRYFKNYHTPLVVDIPLMNKSEFCVCAKIYSFGVISLYYKIPFYKNLEDIRNEIESIDLQFEEQSMQDAHTIFKRIKKYTNHAKFYNLRTSYDVIQINNGQVSTEDLQKKYSNIICSILRFETQTLSEYQKNEILSTASSYYRSDFIVIDINAAFIADDQYEELVDLFEFANIQGLQLQYFDKYLDSQLNAIYEHKIGKIPWTVYLPFTSSHNSPIEQLSRTKVEISVITERLENSIKLTSDAYYMEIYNMLVKKLDLSRWRESISTKLNILKDLLSIYNEKINGIREEILSVLVIILIFIELVVGVLSYISHK
jgi:hypothetical protein